MITHLLTLVRLPRLFAQHFSSLYSLRVIHAAFMIEVVIPPAAPFAHPSSAACFAIARRYSDFVSLFEQLRSSDQPESVSAAALLLPQLPPKRLGGGGDVLKTVADARRLQLEDFIQALVRSVECMNTAATAAFFDLVRSSDSSSQSPAAPPLQSAKPILHATIQSVRLFPAFSAPIDRLPVVLCVHGFRSNKDSWY
jgi:hypothetical protein